MAVPGYYRFPAVYGTEVIFCCENDLWQTRIEALCDGVAKCAPPTRLTTEASSSFPAISPDGAHLAYSCDATGSYEVHLMPRGGGQPRQLTYLGSDAVVFGWTPDSRFVLFHSSAKQARTSRTAPTMITHHVQPPHPRL